MAPLALQQKHCRRCCLGDPPARGSAIAAGSNHKPELSQRGAITRQSYHSGELSHLRSISFSLSYNGAGNPQRPSRAAGGGGLRGSLTCSPPPQRSATPLRRRRWSMSRSGGSRQPPFPRKRSTTRVRSRSRQGSPSVAGLPRPGPSGRVVALLPRARLASSGCAIEEMGAMFSCALLVHHRHIADLSSAGFTPARARDWLC